MNRWIDGTGIVSAISYPGKVTNPAVRVVLDFAAGPLLLIFQSRTNLRAIDIGQRLHVYGNCVRRGDTRILYNPRYEILS
ncbi:hypothetical protein RQN30_00505 [Arcanobacterium hippocoleae]